MSTFFSIFVFFLELHPSSLSPEFFLSSSRLLSFMIYNCILLLLPLLSNDIGASGPLLSSSMVLKSGMKLEIPQMRMTLCRNTLMEIFRKMFPSADT
ncbi:hypothetical protein SOVF_009490 isoform B [Spinacia oleracea]|nr:hypothetical protein SOVF_009490 isoform B [Spinacia oleracea]